MVCHAPSRVVAARRCGPRARSGGPDRGAALMRAPRDRRAAL